jgi:hypothetical protein
LPVLLPDSSKYAAQKPMMKPLTRKSTLLHE